jgi:RHS repeat-associated protein
MTARGTQPKRGGRQCWVDAQRGGSGMSRFYRLLIGAFLFLAAGAAPSLHASPDPSNGQGHGSTQVGDWGQGDGHHGQDGDQGQGQDGGHGQGGWESSENLSPKLNLEVWSNGWDGHKYQLSARITNLGCDPVSVSDLAVGAWFYDGLSRTWLSEAESGSETIFDAQGHRVGDAGKPVVSVNALSQTLTCGSTQASDKVQISFPGSHSFIPPGGYLSTGDSPVFLAEWYPSDHSTIDGSQDYSPVRQIVGNSENRTNSSGFVLYDNGKVVREYLPPVATELAPGLDPNSGQEPCGITPSADTFDKTFQKPSWAVGQSSLYGLQIFDGGKDVGSSQLQWSLVGTSSGAFQLQFAELSDPQQPLLKQMTLPTLTPDQFLSLIGQEWGNLPIQQFISPVGDGSYESIQTPNPDPVAEQVQNVITQEFHLQKAVSITTAAGTFVGNRYVYEPTCPPVSGLLRMVVESSPAIPVTGIAQFSMTFAYQGANGEEREHEFRYTLDEIQRSGAVSGITGTVIAGGTFVADSGTAGITRLGQPPLRQNPTTIGPRDVGIDVRDAGDPVTTKDGILHFQVADIYNPRPGFPMSLVRHYNSRVNGANFALGPSWISDYDSYIYVSTTTDLFLVGPDTVAEFKRPNTSTNTFSPVPGSFGTLALVASQPNTTIASVGTIYSNYQYTANDGTISYFSAFAPGPQNVCKLTRTVDRLGNYFDCVYEGFLTQQLYHSPVTLSVPILVPSVCSQRVGGGWFSFTIYYPCLVTDWVTLTLAPAFIDNQSYDTRLVQVHSDSANNWSIDFGHAFNPQQNITSGPNIYERFYGGLISDAESYSGTQNLDRVQYGYTYYGSSTAGQFGQYSLTSVQRGTNANPTSGFPATYIYASNVLSGQFPVLTNKSDAKGQGNLSIPAQKAGSTSRKGNALLPQFYQQSSPNIATDYAANDDAHVSFTYASKPDPGAGNALRTSDQVSTIVNGRGQLNEQLAISYLGGANQITQTTLTNSIGTSIVDVYWNNLLHTRTYYFGGGVTHTETYGYDANFLMNSELDGNGHNSSSTYDGNGNLLNFIDQIGGQQVYTYNAFGQVLSYTDQAGSTTKFSYDTIGNLVNVAQPLGKATSYTYDSRGLVTQVVSPNGYSSSTIYDANGNPQSSTNESGFTRNYVYDPYSRQVSVTNPDGFKATNTINYKNQITQTQYSDGSSQTKSFDTDGNMLSMVDRNGKTTDYAYDTDDNLISVKTFPRSGVTTTLSYGYDPNDNRTTITDPDGNIYSFHYNPLNLVTSVTNPKGKTRTLTYDGAYNLTGFVDENGVSQVFTYQANNFNIQQSFSNGDPTQMFGYDSVGDMTSVTDAEGTKTLGYDSLHRLLQVANSAQGSILTYAYDLNGNRVSMAESKSGRQVTYSYFADNRPRQKQDSIFGTTQFDYDSAGRPQGAVFPNGTRSSITYGLNEAITSLNYFDISNVKIWGETYTNDSLGNVLSKTDPYRTMTYIYDNTYQLLGEQNAADATQNNTYTYDAAGNRQSSVQLGVSQTYQYGVDNQISFTHGPVNEAFVHDASGNLTSDIQTGGLSRVYTWDAIGNLKSANVTPVGGATYNVAFTYDYASRRVKRVSSVTGITKYIFDGDAPIVETDGNGAVSEIFDGGVGYRDVSGTVNYFVMDRNHNVLALTDQNGNLIQKIRSGPYGAEQLQLSDTNKYQFAGASGNPFDAELGLNYMMRRWYDPRTGQFISKDPAGFYGGINLYNYVGNNPITRMDPAGTSWFSDMWNNATENLNWGTFWSSFTGPSPLATFANNFVNGANQFNVYWGQGMNQFNNNWNQWNSSRNDKWVALTGGTWQGFGTWAWHSTIVSGHIFTYGDPEQGNVDNPSILTIIGDIFGWGWIWDIIKVIF